VNRGSPCQACISPHLGVINSMIAAGTKLTEIAATTGLSKYSLSRHKRHSAQSPAIPAEISQDPREQEINLWLSRANELYLCAGLQGDVRSQAAALGQGLKALEFDARRRGELLASQLAQVNQAKKTDDFPFEKRPLTIETLDAAVRASERDDELRGVAICPRCAGRGRIPLAKVAS
jgi:hypothetical protein